jgi:RsiW-degrading membrane proteinase PrsW (M82 family)
MNFYFILFIIFGIIPSLAWLSYYLRKDVHPESNRMVLKIFLWGALITFPVFLVQIGLATLLGKCNFPPLAITLIYWFIVIALSEEFFKYLVIRGKIINSPELDEPLDLMLYMVIAALGFAALENVLYLFTPIDQLSFNSLVNRTLIISFIRFIGATFLHTLCSATIGYFIALSFFDTNKKKMVILTICGIILAAFLHGLYNFSIMTMEGSLKFIIPSIILILLAIFVFSKFNKLKNMKGISIIK